MNAPDVSHIGFIAITVILLGFAATVLWLIVTNKIDLKGLVSEPIDPNNRELGQKASLSRFQFLIFTFVIAGLYLLLCIETGAFVEIPTNVLGLLGISGGSFVVSKAVGSQKDKGKQGDKKPDAPQQPG